MLKQKPSTHLLFVCSLILYVVAGYFIDRHQTLPLFACYFSLFIVYVLIVRDPKALPEQLRFWLGAAMIFRVSLLFALPALSDDFYRFIWDGRLLAAGHNPFSEVPAGYLDSTPPIPGIDHDLYQRLNATRTYTIYPPLAQLIFWLSVIIAPDSIIGSAIVMRVIIVLFELATLWILAKVLDQFGRPRSTLLLYALNPLVILELSGNLHHEGIMLFFIFLSIYLLRKGHVVRSCAAYALAISTKLIPLLFLPLLIRYLGWKKATAYWVVTGLITLLFFLPLLSDDFINGMSTSLGYYFQRFEFNASLYYLIREVGYVVAGFNVIQYVGPVLGGLVFIAIWIIALRKLPHTFAGIPERRLFCDMMWALTLYFLATTILHPWYIITLFGLSLLTTYRFPFVWTAMIFLTYAGYRQEGFVENMILVALEYLLVIGYLLYETVWRKRRIHC